MAVGYISTVTIIFYEILYLSGYYMEQKIIHRSKYYTLEKNIFHSCYLWKFASSFTSDQVKKLVVYFSLYESSFHL